MGAVAFLAKYPYTPKALSSFVGANPALQDVAMAKRSVVQCRFVFATEEEEEGAGRGRGGWWIAEVCRAELIVGLRSRVWWVQDLRSVQYRVLLLFDVIRNPRLSE